MDLLDLVDEYIKQYPNEVDPLLLMGVEGVDALIEKLAKRKGRKIIVEDSLIKDALDGQRLVYA